MCIDADLAGEGHGEDELRGGGVAAGDQHHHGLARVRQPRRLPRPPPARGLVLGAQDTALPRPRGQHPTSVLDNLDNLDNLDVKCRL